MKYFQEVTEWDASYVPNHVYYLTDDKRKMVGYIKTGTKALIKFSKPMNFDSKGRKFVVLPKKGESDEVYFPKSVEKPVGQVIEVSGSNGKKYFLSKFGKGWSCSCPGYQFRHKCKHVDEMKEV
jgi:queuine/archaeosine tRNA-ribosyltransferase